MKLKGNSLETVDMKFKTVQASSFKAVFEVLKDILNDVNIYFNEDGMSLITLDTARSALVSLQLSADNFEEYECDKPIIAGINISNVFKLLKSISSSDILSVEIQSRDIMSIYIENTTKKSSTKFELKLLEIDEEQIELPEVPVNITTVLSSVDFQRICRDMSNLSQELTMTREKNRLVIVCQGDFANQKTIIECPDNTLFHCHGVYSLKYLNIFTKATGMCSNVQIMHEKANRFLVLQYNVANLGELKFYLATKVQDN